MSRPRSQRNANTDFAMPLNHRVEEDAIQADASQQDSDDGEEHRRCCEHALAKGLRIEQFLPALGDLASVRLAYYRWAAREARLGAGTLICLQ